MAKGMISSMEMTNSLARTGLLALLLAVAAQAAAQAPPHALFLSASAVQAFAREQASDLQMLTAVEGSKQRAGKVRAPLVRPDRWTLFGRVGPLRFANQLDAGTDGMQFALRGNNSQGLQGKFYLGIHRTY